MIFNVLSLYFLGRELLPLLGTKRFLSLFAAATVAGAVLWAGVHWHAKDEVLIGSTAAVAALFVVFACFFPNQRIGFLLFFLFPVTLRPKHLAIAVVATTLLVFCCYEVPRNALPFDATVASSAHLGGMLTGYFYYRFVHDARWLGAETTAEIALPRLQTRAKKVPTMADQTSTPPPAAPGTHAFRAEVDRILDKINSAGFGSLTPVEKQTLDRAKELLSRR